jgi:tRNA1Val (adenine37-N6)-methyltransferase
LTAQSSIERRKPAKETVDSICSVQIVQSADGYRFNVDPILLAHFAAESITRKAGSIMDLGTGSGVVALLLAKKFQLAPITGVELQQSLFELAVRNVRLNGCERAVSMVHGDLRRSQDLFPASSFRWVAMNPPYRSPAKGRTNPHPERAFARHELSCSLNDVVAAARHLLEDRGGFFCVYPAGRLSTLLATLREARLCPKRLRLVHPRLGQPAKLALVEAEKNGRSDLQVESPLFLHAERGSAYVEEVQQMLGAEADAPPASRPLRSGRS